MTSKVQKEILVSLKNLSDLLIEANRADRLSSLERTVDILTGNLEEEIKRRKALERYLRVKFNQSVEYQRVI